MADTNGCYGNRDTACGATWGQPWPTKVRSQSRRCREFVTNPLLRVGYHTLLAQSECMDHTHDWSIAEQGISDEGKPFQARKHLANIFDVYACTKPTATEFDDVRGANIH